MGYNDNLEKVRQSLIKAQYSVPDSAQFVKDMQDEGNLRRVHQSLIDSDYDVPDYDTFRSDMGVGVDKPISTPYDPSGYVFTESELAAMENGEKKPAAKPAKAKSAPAKQATKVVNKSKMTPIGAMPNSTPAKADFMKLDTKDLNTWRNPYGNVKETRQHAQMQAEAPKDQLVSDTFKAIKGDEKAAKRIGRDKAMQQAQDRLEYAQLTNGEELKGILSDAGIERDENGKAILDKDNKPIAIADSKILAPIILRDEEGNAIIGEDGKPLVGLTGDQARVNAQNRERARYKENEYKSGEIQRAQDKLAEIEQRIKEIENAGKNGEYKELSDLEQLDIYTNLKRLNYARDNVREQIGMLEKMKSGENESFLTSFFNTLSDPEILSSGFSDTSERWHKLYLNAKMSLGMNLTDDEKTYLSSIKDREDTEGRANEQSTMWERGGETTARMFPFMLGMLVTEGLPGVQKIGTAAAEKATQWYLSRYGVKSFGEYLTKKGAKSALDFARKYGIDELREVAKAYGMKNFTNDAVKNVMKATGAFMGDLMVGGVMANSVGAANTFNDVVDTYLGQLTYDDEGNIKFEGGEPLLKSLYQGVTRNTLEYATELMGDNILNPLFRKMLGIGGMKVLAKVMSGEVGPEAWKNTIKWLGKTGIQGLGAEGAEEEVNMILGIGLHAGDTDEQVAQFLDSDTHKEIWGDMAMSIGFLHGVMLGLNEGKRGLVKTYDTAQYYRYQRKLDKSSRDAEYKIGEGWNALREKIDATSNDDMGKMYKDILLDKGLNVEKKNAAIRYMNNLIQMRGYNLGRWGAAKQNAEEGKNEVVENKTPEEEIETQIEASTNDGYNASEPEDMQDIQNKMVILQGEIGDEMLVADLDSNPILTISRIEDEELRQKAIDYVNAKAAYDGMIDRVGDDIDRQVQAAEQQIDSRVNIETGNVIAATTKDNRQVFIVSGNVALKDGAVDAANSSAFIVVRDQDGNVSSLSPQDFLSVEEPADPNQLKAEAGEAIRNAVADENLSKMNNTLAFQQGDVYDLVDEQGVQHQVQIVADNGDGTVNAIVDGKQEEAFPKETIQQMADATSMQRTQEKMKQEQEAEVSVANEENGTAETPAESPDSPVAEAEPIPMIGEGEEAEADFLAVSPARGHDYLYNELGIKEEAADKIVANKLAEAQKELEELDKKEPQPGTNATKYKAEMDAWEEQKAEAQMKVDYWNSVASIHEAQKAEVQAQEQAEVQAQQQEQQEQQEEQQPAEEEQTMLSQESEQPAAEEAPIEQEQPEATAEDKEEERRKPLRERAKEWEERLGVKVHLLESVDDIESRQIREQIAEGKIKVKDLNAWMIKGKDEIYIFMPNMRSLYDIDRHYMHEAVSHYGLPKMIGEKAFNELCDTIFSQMDKNTQNYWLNYAKSGRNAGEYTQEQLQRIAADEYIAHLAERIDPNPSAWKKIVEALRQVLSRIGIATELKDKDLIDLIRESYATLKREQEEKLSSEVDGLAKKGMETDTEKGDVRFAVADVLEGDEREQAIKELMEVTGRSRSTVVKWLKAEESLAKVILDGDNVGFLDLQVDESVPSIWNNSDYPQGTVEFSNICRKRLPFTIIYQRLQQEFPNMVFDASTLEDIRGIMKENGVDVACGLCFVEDRRQLLGEIGEGFIKMLNGENTDLNENQTRALERLRMLGDDYVPNLYELLTLDGMKKLRKEHPAVAQAFIEYNNARGMQAGRLFQAYSAYHRDILKWDKKKVKSVNDAGGLRIFSFSDFEAHHLIDLVQVLTDCAAKGVKVQGYTKVPEFAKAVKDTGMKLNRSLIAKGDGFVDEGYVPQKGEAVSPNVVDGKRLILDTVEGIDVNHPDFFDSTDNKNVGNILVGINDEQIRIAMADPFVDYIIPFHSGLSEAIRNKKGIGNWVNYKLVQLEKKYNDSGKLVNADKHGINIYTDVLPKGEELIGHPIRNAKDFQQAFFKACEKKGWVPRFSQFINTNKKGEYVYTPGYEKLLLDFKLFDKNGKILPQESVVPVFDNEYNKKILDDYVKGQKAGVSYDELYEKVKESLGLGQAESADNEMAEEGQVRFSLVTDPFLYADLEAGEKEIGYRNVVLNEDGTLGSPVAKSLGKTGEKSRPTSGFGFGRWERSDENPDMADEKGKVTLNKPSGKSIRQVDYNPYIHIRPTSVNTQFKEAWDRPELVYIRTSYPASELTSGYHADKAKLPVGRHPWGGGELILSRYDKPMEVVPWEEVADQWMEHFGNKPIHFDIIPAKLLPVLTERGANIVAPHKNMGKDCNDAYNEWKEQQNKKEDVRFSLGVPYHGSKNRIATKIVDKLPSGDRFVDLFSGGGAMTHAAMLSGKYNTYRMNDINPAGQDLFLQGMRGEWRDYDRKNMTEEEFNAIKGTPEAIVWSYSGLGRNLAKSKGNRNKAEEQIRRVKNLESLKEYADLVDDSATDYREVALRPGDVIYADIPYEGTDQLAYRQGRFNKQEFIDWAQAQDVPIYVSEYSMPEGWTEIASFPVRDIRKGNKTEKLFVQSKFAGNGNEDVRFSVTPEEDKAYMDAVNSGDMETAQRMVGEVAKKAMPDTQFVDENGEPMLMSHHTDAEGFYVFDKGKIGTGQGQAFLGAGFNFSRGRGDSTYGSRNISAYLNAKTPLRSDRNTLSKSDIRSIIEELNAKYPEDKIEVNWGSMRDAVNALYEYGGDLDTYATLCMTYSGNSTDVMDVFAKRGFDSTIEYDNDGRIMDGVVFNPNQIKSADPVTYDDNGNVIPLSERFNDDNEDIRFSVAWHGSPADFTEFEEGHYREGVGSFHRPGFYFASDNDVARHYAYNKNDGGYLYEVELPDDDGTNYLNVFKTIDKSRRREIAKLVDETFPEKNIDTEKQIVNKAIAGEDLMKMFTNDELRQLGFVGVRGPMGIATSGIEQTIMFSPEDIRIASKQRVEDDVRFSTAIDELNDKGISIDNPELLDEYGLKNLTLEKSGDIVKVSKIIANEQGKGNGTRFMDYLTDLADKNGWTLALTPDTSFGASSVSRLKKFYNRFGFKDNKGRNTNFETRESMVREPEGDVRFSVGIHSNEFKDWFGDWELYKLYNQAQRAWNDKNSKEKFVFEPSLRAKSRMEELLGHTISQFVITDDSIRHIKNNHGHGEELRGQIDMAPEDIVTIPYLVNNFDSMDLSPKYNDKLGNRAIEIRKRINGTSIIATIEKGKYKEFLVTGLKLKKSDASDAPKRASKPNAQSDSDIAKVKKDIETIKQSAKNSSKIVDKNGEPLVLYRGGERIDTFDPDKASGNAMYGKAFYATTNKDEAASVAKARTGNENDVQAVYLNIRNPFVDAQVEELGYPPVATDEEVKALIDVLKTKGLKDGSSIYQRFINGRIPGSIIGYLSSSEYEGRERNAGEMWHASDIVQDALKELGYDGVVGKYQGENFYATQVAAFYPNQIKSATDNNGEYSRENDDIRFSITEPAPIFVSNAKRAVDGIKQEKATPEQWLAMITKNGGIKAGEDKWLGLSDWLKSQDKKTLTKKDVLDYIRENQIEVQEVHYADMNDLPSKDDVKNTPQFKKLANEYQQEIDNAPTREEAEDADWEYRNELEGKYGEDFDEDELTEEERNKFDRLQNAYAAYDSYENDDEAKRNFAYFELSRKHEGFMQAFDYDQKSGVLNPRDTRKAMTFLNGNKQANPVRLTYTTRGLQNNREIALVVPTIKSWNESDQVHFGDAGDGRAIAWIRFGDAETRDLDAEKAFRDAGVKVIVAFNDNASKEEIESLQRQEREARDKIAKRVLVIDEIQSKRHQEGRDKGYRDEPLLEELDKEWRNLNNEKISIVKDILHRAGYKHYLENDSNLPYSQEHLDKAENGRIGYPAEEKRIKEINERLEEIHKEQREIWDKIPDAPFDKNWHELAMKRMLRYAAENGYDKVAWTTGDHQARRYNLAKKISNITVDPNGDGTRTISLDYKHDEGYMDFYQMFVDGEGKIYSGDYSGNTLAEVVGKELAVKLMSAKDRQKLDGEDLRVGGEGMKGFYDKMLPSFMNKYGKKWGAKVEDIPVLGHTMHSVDVTPEMKESVMNEGQVMFSLGSTRDEVEKFTSKYNSRPVSFVDLSMSDEELIDAFDISEEYRSEENVKEVREYLEEEKPSAFYDNNTGKIYIFAGHLKPEKVEEALFHENLHALLHEMYGDGKRNIAERFWDIAPDKGKVKRSFIEKKYNDEDERKEELFVYWLSRSMRDGDVDDMLKMFDDYGDVIRTESFLENIGYDNERESAERREEERRGDRVHQETSASVQPELGRGGVGDEDIRFSAEVEDTPEQVARKIYEDAVTDTGEMSMLNAFLHMFGKEGRKRFKHKFSESWFDYTHSIKALQDAIAKATSKPIAHFENVWKALNAKSSVDSEEIADVMLRLIVPLSEHIGNMIKGKQINGRDLTFDDVEIYMNAVHGIERNEKMAEKYAQEEYDKAVADGKTPDMQKLIAKNRRDYSGLTALFSEAVGKDNPTIDELENAAREYARQFEDEVGKDACDEMWSLVKALNNYSLRKSYVTGLISKEQYDDTMNMYEHYVPLRGWHDNYAGDVYQYISRGEPAGVMQSVMKKAYGRKSRAARILGTMAAMANSSIVQGNKNVVAQKLLNLARNHRDAGLLMVSDAWYQKNANGEYVLQTPNLTDNMTPEEVQQEVERFNQEMEAKERNHEVVRIGGRFSKSFPLSMSKWQEQAHAVRVLEYGKERMVYILGNPRAAMAFNGLLNKESDPSVVTDLISKYMRFLAKMQTSLSPEFLISNFMRDITTAATGTYIKYGKDAQKKFLANLARLMPLMSVVSDKYDSKYGIYDLFGKYENGTLDNNNEIERMFGEFVKHGGMTGISYITRAEEYQDQMTTIIKRMRQGKLDVARQLGDHLSEMVEFANKGIENATRFAMYLTSRQMGKSIPDSIFDAKEASVNFNMKGSGAWGNMFARKYLLYVNPAMQALRMLGTWFESDGSELSAIVGNEKAKGSRARFIKAAATILSASVTTAMLNIILSKALGHGGGGDDDDKKTDWWGLSEWDRYNYVNIINPTGRGYFHWSIPQELRPLWALGQIAVDRAYGRITDGMAINSMIMQMNNLTPISFFEGGVKPDESIIDAEIRAFTPDFISPFTDAYGWNRDFLGHKITNQQEWNKHLPEWQRADDDTPEWLIAGSRKWNDLWGGRKNYRSKMESPYLNPSALYYIFTQQFGGIGSMAKRLARGLEQWKNPDEEVEVRNIPFLPKFYVSTGSDYSQNRVTNDRFWTLWNEYQDANTELTANRRDSLNNAIDPMELAKTYDERMKDGSYQKWEMVKKYNLDKVFEETKGTENELAVKQMIVETLSENKAPDFKPFFENAKSDDERFLWSNSYAKQFGVQDEYGKSPSKDWKEQTIDAHNSYRRLHREWDNDVKEDIALEAEEKRAKDNGDNAREKQISGLRKSLRGTIMNLGKGDDDSVMSIYREKRHKVVDAYKKKRNGTIDVAKALQ